MFKSIALSLLTFFMIFSIQVQAETFSYPQLKLSFDVPDSWVHYGEMETSGVITEIENSNNFSQTAKKKVNALKQFGKQMFRSPDANLVIATADLRGQRIDIDQVMNKQIWDMSKIPQIGSIKPHNCLDISIDKDYKCFSSVTSMRGVQVETMQYIMVIERFYVQIAVGLKIGASNQEIKQVLASFIIDDSA